VILDFGFWILDFGFWIVTTQAVWWRAACATKIFSRFSPRFARAETAKNFE
jgi:hypothetical protein